MVAERAARRAIEAISRTGTLTTDITVLNERITALEGLCDTLLTIIKTITGE
jgi:hypothetical protein